MGQVTKLRKIYWEMCTLVVCQFSIQSRLEMDLLLVRNAMKHIVKMLLYVCHAESRNFFFVFICLPTSLTTQKKKFKLMGLDAKAE